MKKLICVFVFLVSINLVYAVGEILQASNYTFDDFSNFTTIYSMTANGTLQVSNLSFSQEDLLEPGIDEAQQVDINNKGMANPTAVFCECMGGDYILGGTCEIRNRELNAWEFYLKFLNIFEKWYEPILK